MLIIDPGVPMITERNNLRARAPNSLEDAHDYLVSAQEAWMKPDVWVWASSQQDAQSCVMKQCTRSGCENHEESVAQFKRCASCHLVFYCSRDCQKADWKTHKPGEFLIRSSLRPRATPLTERNTRMPEVPAAEEDPEGGDDSTAQVESRDARPLHLCISVSCARPFVCTNVQLQCQWFVLNLTSLDLLVKLRQLFPTCGMSFSQCLSRDPQSMPLGEEKRHRRAPGATFERIQTRPQLRT